jgi:glycosyltransferase involved in cell wall biosynthesis
MMRVSLLTGGDDPNYAIPLAVSLSEEGIDVEFIGNDSMATVDALQTANITYLNLRGNQDPRSPLLSKIGRVLMYYSNLISYTFTTEPRVFHILWLNKFELFDRTVMNLIYKLKRKKVVFTAHNVNTKKRDGVDTWTNRATLKVMYALVDHIFVHTDLSKDELVRDYGVSAEKVTVIPFGLNTYVPDTRLSKLEARARLGLDASEDVILFFGQIAPYKGLDVLLDAVKLASEAHNLRLIIAGRPKDGLEAYWRALKSSLHGDHARSKTLIKDEYIPDDQVSVLFRAADALILPYRAIYQSGPLSLAYRFGVPVIATRVGAFERDVVPGVTGLLCRPGDATDLARAIREYFSGGLHSDAERARARIREIGAERFSWRAIGRTIAEVYTRLDNKEALVC